MMSFGLSEEERQIVGVVREWVDEQASQQALVTDSLRELAQNLGRRGGK